MASDPVIRVEQTGNDEIAEYRPPIRRWLLDSCDSFHQEHLRDAHQPVCRRIRVEFRADFTGGRGGFDVRPEDVADAVAKGA